MRNSNTPLSYSTFGGFSMLNFLKLLALFGLSLVISSCGNVRELPTNKVITLYNANMEETRNMTLLDTLYVQVAGLTPFQDYDLIVTDPQQKEINHLKLSADDQGILMSAVWYDVGLKRTSSTSEVATPDLSSGLSVNAFNVQVTGSDGTDYHEPFFIVTSNNNVGKQPQPIVWATSSAIRDSGFENAFDETGTVTADGYSGLTKVYVEARNIPGSINGTAVSQVDIYVLKTKGVGNNWIPGDSLVENFITRIQNVAVVDDGHGSKELANPVLLWDLDNPLTTLINPNEENSSFDIVLDVNQNGQFDLGEDIDADGITDKFIDGIDGQGVVGFIVGNTEANELFISIKDSYGNVTDTITDTNGSLFIEVLNLPFGTTTPVLTLYQQGTQTIALPAANLTVTTPAAPAATLPSVASSLFVDTAPLSALSPVGVQLTATQSYDLVVSGIANMEYRSSIKVIHAPTLIKTSTSAADTTGASDSTLFDETGTPSGNTKVYAYTSGLGLPVNSTVSIYVVPHLDSWVDGIGLTSNTAMVTATVQSGTDISPTLIWNLDGSNTLQNPNSSNNAYDIILDRNNDGIYTAASDTLNSLGFVIRDTAANNTANLQYLNIASGGKFSSTCYRSAVNGGDCSDFDYRDTFALNGLDTLQNHYVSYGIKAIWNPYIKRSRSSAPTGNRSLYYGQRVDVYVIDASTADLSANAPLGSGGNADVTGRVDTLPVQYGCYNGAGQQNIWTPAFTTGRYFVVVDINQDGLLTEDLDLVDAVTRNGTTIADDPTVVGFTVQ